MLGYLRSNYEHSRLVDAIEARDSEKAITLMMNHMDHIEAKLNLGDDRSNRDLHAIFSHLAPAGS